MKQFPLTPKESAKSLLIAGGAFVLIGTVTALWHNPFFTRMTPTSGYELWLLLAESLLLGAYLGTDRTKQTGTCSTIGGVLGFLGIACPVCNKILLLLFGSTLLLSYFEPIRLYVGIVGVLLLAFAVYKKLSPRFPHSLALISFTPLR